MSILKNEYLIDKKYKYWQIRIFYSIFIGYIFFYFTRKSYTFLMPTLSENLNLSKGSLGIINTIFYITYGISKLISGIISDKTNPRYIMSFGLMFTGILNILFGMSSSITMLIIFWSLNGWFQGWGWPPITKQLTYWFSAKERGLWWSLCSTSHNIGGAITPILIGIITESMGWRYGMYIPGIVCIIISFFLINRLRDIPKSLGLPPIEIYKNEKIKKEKSHKNNMEIKKVIIEHIIKNKLIMILAITYIFVYIIRTSINDWGIIFLINKKNHNLITAGTTIFFFEIGGLIGMILSGWITDKIFKGERIMFTTICSIILTISIIIFWHSPINNKSIDYIIMSIIGFLIFAPQMLVGLIATESVNKKVACTANGFVGCAAYIGAAITGYPLGIIIDISWDLFFVMLVICSIVIISLMTLILITKQYK